MITKEQVLERLEKVLDPELHINVVELGLIYEVKVVDNNIFILMTLTFPGCPLGSIIHSEINEALASLEGVGKIDLKITFDPPWDLSKISQEAKADLGML